MAGIGIELRKIFEAETFASAIRGYFLGAVVVLGPFACLVLGLGGLTLLSREVADPGVRQAFAGAVVYVFGGTLIATGAVQVVVTRYVADRIYLGEEAGLVHTFFPVVLTTSLLLAGSAAPWVGLIEVPALPKLLIFSLYMTMGFLWVLVVFVTEAHRHRTIVAIFFAGSLLALGSGLLLVRFMGLEGLLFGYLAGHFFMLAAFTHTLVSEFGYPRRWDWGVLGYLRRYPFLVLIGLFGPLGIWIDKFIFWGSELSLTAAGLTTAPKYDSSTFLGFFTVLPAVVHFYVRTEADFSRGFQLFYDAVFFRRPYDRIAAAAASLRASVLRALLDTLKIQGVLTFLFVFFAVEFLDGVGLPVSQVGMFRFAAVGSLALAFMLFSNVLLLYMDRQREVLSTLVVFFGANVVLTRVSLEVGYPAYGLGFAAACWVGALLSTLHLTNQLFNLEFMTFAMRPVMGQRPARPALRAGPSGGYGRYVDLGQARGEPS